MTDCYKILGVPPDASAADIRLVYLAKMKALHPDAAKNAARGDVGAGEVSAAYWQLRDSGRREQHDRQLKLLWARPASATQTVSRRRVLSETPLAVRQRRRRRSRLRLFGAAAGAAAMALLAPAGILLFTYFQSAEPARASRGPDLVPGIAKAVGSPSRARRMLDARMASAASEDFRATIYQSGLEGAYATSRQCLSELILQPNLGLLDYCIAYDSEAARWEETVTPERAEHLFGSAQRAGRYGSAGQAIHVDYVRQAMLREAADLGNSAN